MNQFFDIALQKARSMLKDNDQVLTLIANVSRKIANNKLDITSVGKKLKVFMRMIRAYVSGEYREIPWKSLIVITAVLIYFFMPLDLIPDFVPVTGYVDDFSLVIWAFTHLQDDIQTYIWWEENREQ